MTTSFGADDGARRRAHIETVLADYPRIEPEQTETLLRWFRKEATALDVGLIASDPQLAEPYRRFRAEHLDRLSGADIVRALLVVCVVVAGIVAIVLGTM